MEISSNEAVYLVTESQLKELVSMTCMEFIAGLKEKNEAETCSKIEAAQQIGVSRETIYHMIKDGRLIATADGKRILTSSIKDYKSGKTEKTDTIKTNKRGRKIYV